MKNTISKFLFFLIFAVAFAVPAFFVVPTIQNHFKWQAIAKHGTEINATPVSYHSNVTINDEEIYYITYEYTINGQTYTGKTDSRYKLYQAQRIINSKQIHIKYNKNFESCEADYTISSSSQILIIALSVFLLADLVFWIIEIRFVVKFVGYAVVSIKGKEYEAQFVTLTPGMCVNSVQYYHVSYSWKDDNGQIRNGIFGDYTFSEASMFESIKTFRISAYKSVSKIIDKPSELMFRVNDNLQDTTQKPETEHEAKLDYFECLYCGSVFTKPLTKCSSCGAPIKKTKKN